MHCCVRPRVLLFLRKIKGGVSRHCHILPVTEEQLTLPTGASSVLTRDSNELVMKVIRHADSNKLFVTEHAGEGQRCAQKPHPVQSPLL